MQCKRYGNQSDLQPERREIWKEASEIQVINCLEGEVGVLGISAGKETPVLDLMGRLKLVRYN